MIEKPEKPFKDKTDEMKRYCYWNETCPFGKVPCQECRGKGWAYDPNDKPDPVEGYKLVDRITCKTCKGKRFSQSPEDIKAFNNFVKEQKIKYKLKLAQYKVHKKIVSSALKKLNRKEIEVLKEEFSR